MAVRNRAYSWEGLATSGTREALFATDKRPGVMMGSLSAMYTFETQLQSLRRYQQRRSSSIPSSEAKHDVARVLCEASDDELGYSTSSSSQNRSGARSVADTEFPTFCSECARRINAQYTITHGNQPSKISEPEATFNLPFAKSIIPIKLRRISALKGIDLEDWYRAGCTIYSMNLPKRLALLPALDSNAGTSLIAETVAISLGEIEPLPKSSLPEPLTFALLGNNKLPIIGTIDVLVYFDNLAIWAWVELGVVKDGDMPKQFNVLFGQRICRKLGLLIETERLSLAAPSANVQGLNRKRARSEPSTYSPTVAKRVR